MFDKIDIDSLNAIRALSVCQIQKANSGHPGIPMDAAPMAYVIWKKFLNIDPEDENWFNRDRFVLSPGHGSSMLYSLLHLSGFDISIEDLKNFRQLNSKTPGHPEMNFTKGIETTTGPLGQGVANAVGMAMAEAHLANIYNKEKFNIIDHYTYVICSDGDLMEGISYEACSIAGNLKLKKLIMLYDSNDVSLDGALEDSNSENTKLRFESMNWDYQLVSDGENLEMIEKAIENAKKTDKPSLIEVKTVIGKGSEFEGTNKVHGAPLSMDDFRRAEKVWGWDYEDFEVPKEVYERFSQIKENGKIKHSKWNELFLEYKKNYPNEVKRLERGINKELPENFEEKIISIKDDDKPIATRSISGKIIQEISKQDIDFWGGSADLASSNKTKIESDNLFSSKDYSARNIQYGVREHAMASIANGILAHGGTWTFVSTFFVFSDYLRGASRISSLSKIPLIYVFTHDSVAVGEDGPTHQPIEHLATLRAVPNMNVFRPANSVETKISWVLAMNSKETPTSIVLTRQNVDLFDEKTDIEDIKKGAYIISKSKKELPDGILIATGSEVKPALDAKKLLLNDGIDVSVVSMLSMEIFRNQSEEYKQKVLPKEVKNRVSIEMGDTFGWDEFVLENGIKIGIDRFGLSAPAEEVIEYFGFTPENIAKKYKEKYVWR
ncbi:MAG: transketolase [Peptoniphilaceae bacterium]|nr:transketolase [Peptoniphilaceae bacterium]MDD7383357.1 transketolase [Peptoniphilaceae bacterium]MDY3738272.1 transketolase [Peptoniphilaceae bacterium]